MSPSNETNWTSALEKRCVPHRYHHRYRHPQMYGWKMLENYKAGPYNYQQHKNPYQWSYNLTYIHIYIYILDIYMLVDWEVLSPTYRFYQSPPCITMDFPGANPGGAKPQFHHFRRLMRGLCHCYVRLRRWADLDRIIEEAMPYFGHPVGSCLVEANEQEKVPTTC